MPPPERPVQVQEADCQMWTLCANMRPGCEGAPIVRDGPPIKPYDHIPVVPCDDAAIERVAGRIRWECRAKGVRLHESFVELLASAVLEAAGETP